jgi:anti-sigma28 factor (negative regulator of flagellin synthesis)
MRVYDLNLTGAAPGEAGRTQETQTADGPGGSRTAAGNSSGGDRVEFSGAVASLWKAVSSDGANRAARVQELSRQYEAGGYQPDSAAISRGMVAEALSSGAR